MEPNLTIANVALRQIVAGLVRTGLPVPPEDPQLTDAQLAALKVFQEAVKTYNGFVIEGAKPEKGTPWWEAIPVFRTAVQTAVEAGLIQFAYIQKAALDFGAIPDPDTNWKYYWRPEGYYACWQCGGDVHTKMVSNSVHFKEIPMAGSGEVRRSEVPYCPHCDMEPTNGIIQESLYDRPDEEDKISRALRGAGG